MISDWLRMLYSQSEKLGAFIEGAMMLLDEHARNIPLGKEETPGFLLSRKSPIPIVKGLFGSKKRKEIIQGSSCL